MGLLYFGLLKKTLLMLNDARRSALKKADDAFKKVMHDTHFSTRKIDPLSFFKRLKKVATKEVA